MAVGQRQSTIFALLGRQHAIWPDIGAWPLPELRADRLRGRAILAGRCGATCAWPVPARPTRTCAPPTVCRICSIASARSRRPPRHHPVWRGTARIAIARAVLRRPPVLLLTRPPAARRGQQLFIALIDRVSTVTGADRILVIDAGRVRAIGSHAELAGTDDLYRRLATTQLLAAET